MPVRPKLYKYLETSVTGTSDVLQMLFPQWNDFQSEQLLELSAVSVEGTAEGTRIGRS